ncbi:hypothetical protein GGR27_003390 [Lewinella antarctica]|uniref:Uncharacterized protein n=1 Tax=Neolewinella antarctica TaxID=442734 RepID=A0ABX0XGK1_9BACT|nr:hypothetical protein [Neolewinella antarctica]
MTTRINLVVSRDLFEPDTRGDVLDRDFLDVFYPHAPRIHRGSVSLITFKRLITQNNLIEGVSLS